MILKKISIKSFLLILGGFECACKNGFTGDGSACADIDECAEGTDNCGADATCINRPGGFRKGSNMPHRSPLFENRKLIF